MDKTYLLALFIRFIISKYIPLTGLFKPVPKIASITKSQFFKSSLNWIKSSSIFLSVTPFNFALSKLVLDGSLSFSGSLI